MNIEVCKKCKYLLDGNDSYGNIYRCGLVNNNNVLRMRTGHWYENTRMAKEFKPRRGSKKRLVLYENEFVVPDNCPFLLEHTIDKGTKWVN